VSLQSSSFFDYPEQPESQADELVFLPTWTDQDWGRLLAHTETRRFNAGELLISIGDTDRSLFLVAEGSLEVLMPGARGDMRQIATIEAGAIVGEQAFLDGFPRSATVRALTDGELLRLSIEAFEVFAAEEVEGARAMLFDLGRVLSIRLRHTSALLR
jgi:CRP-like cAMP-binding protein